MLAKGIIDDLSRFFEVKKILGPLEKPLEIADYVFYCIKNGSERNFEHFSFFVGMAWNGIVPRNNGIPTE